MDFSLENHWRFSFRFLAIVTLASALLTQGVIGLVFPAKGQIASYIPVWLSMELPAFIGATCFSFLVLHLVYRCRFSELGCSLLVPERTLSVIKNVVLWGAFVTIFWAVLFTGVMAVNSPQEIFEILRKNAFWKAIHQPDRLTYPLIFHSFLLVGLWEEPLARGLIQTALQKRYETNLRLLFFNVRKSTLLAAILFAAWHIDFFSGQAILKELLTAGFILFPVSFLLSYVYEKTGSLLAPILLHNIIDGGKLLVQFIVFSV